MDDLNQAYADAVKAVVGSVVDVYDGEWGARSWERLLVDYESLLHERDPVTSTIAFALARYPQAPLEKVAFCRPKRKPACSGSVKSCIAAMASGGQHAS